MYSIRSVERFVTVGPAMLEEPVRNEEKAHAKGRARKSAKNLLKLEGMVIVLCSVGQQVCRCS